MTICIQRNLHHSFFKAKHSEVYEGFLGSNLIRIEKKNMDNLVSHFLSWIDCFKKVELESMVQLD